jgi:hypothetical protein
MEVAVLIAAGLRAWIDFGVIIAILLLNAVVGWYQEKQAADVVASLKGDIAMKATVVRDGVEQEILAREIVPGDIVRSIPSIQLVDRALIISHRSSSKVVDMERSSQVTAVLSAPTTTRRMDTPTTKPRCAHRVSLERRTGPKMMMRRVYPTVATLSSPLISPP